MQIELNISSVIVLISSNCHLCIQPHSVFCLIWTVGLIVIVVIQNTGCVFVVDTEASVY